eukprot:GCRY01000685.1.p1 GENE.GCRY01000685.1~~GCRY01000685.1.p1  ORF type:complete len:544 (+),score=122.79 GCRY01000685.1:293-1924(+)
MFSSLFNSLRKSIPPLTKLMVGQESEIAQTVFRDLRGSSVTKGLNYFNTLSSCDVFCFESGASSLPHPLKQIEYVPAHLKSIGGGEDSAFSSNNALGVADGVGGWNQSPFEANVALFSRLLMHNSLELFQSNAKDPVFVLKTALSKIDSSIIGSATACLCVLDGEDLSVANIGDSGVMVIRGEDVVLKSSPLLHSWNFPFQVGTNGDRPETAQRYRQKVQEGDVIVVCSDGCFDNLFEPEIVGMVMEGVRAGVSPKIISQRIARKASENSVDHCRPTPFSEEARRANVLDHRLWRGGKVDDVTVVVGVVKKTPRAIPSPLKSTINFDSGIPHRPGSRSPDHNTACHTASKAMAEALSESDGLSDDCCSFGTESPFGDLVAQEEKEAAAAAALATKPRPKPLKARPFPRRSLIPTKKSGLQHEQPKRLLSLDIMQSESGAGSSGGESSEAEPAAERSGTHSSVVDGAGGEFSVEGLNSPSPDSGNEEVTVADPLAPCVCAEVESRLSAFNVGDPKAESGPESQRKEEGAVDAKDDASPSMIVSR